jgi:hypothetical protein
MFLVAGKQLRNIQWNMPPGKENKGLEEEEFYDDDDDDYVERCVACGQGGELVHCGGLECERVFHLECMGLDGLPPSKWYCMDCQEALMVCHLFS